MILFLCQCPDFMSTAYCLTLAFSSVFVKLPTSRRFVYVHTAQAVLCAQVDQVMKCSISNHQFKIVFDFLNKQTGTKNGNF